MKKLTSFALGPIIGLLIYYSLNFIYESIESITNTNLNQLLGYEFDILIILPLLILSPLIFYFLLSKEDNFKQKIIKSILFAGGILFGFVFIFGIAFFFCFGSGTVKGCYPFYTIVFIVLGINLIYLIFRFVDYIKNKNIKQN